MGVKLAYRQPQVYQLLLSRVIDVKYGSFTFFSNFKAGAVGLSLRSMQGPARGTREWERRPPLLLSSCVFDISSFAPPPPPPQKKGSCYAVYD